jgi:DNA-binding transcriptional MocR family regulator
VSPVSGDSTPTYHRLTRICWLRLCRLFRTIVQLSCTNNPAGVSYSAAEIARIAELATKYGVTVIVDELYSRLLYAGQTYTHLRASVPSHQFVRALRGRRSLTRRVA